ncbi:family 20 glycosylhydrolase [Bifidobacterium tsurumiense]|nr:family 20 glycosylhydrolase [Bifidobacterium tsurumiense]
MRLTRSRTSLTSCLLPSSMCCICISRRMKDGASPLILRETTLPESTIRYSPASRAIPHGRLIAQSGLILMDVPVFYNRQQFVDLVSYAASRGIAVVLEIDDPGHSLSALHVIPQ